MARSLKRAKVLHYCPSQSDEIESGELAVGKRGVISLTELEDLRIEVKGQRSTYVVWPGNICWVEPMAALLDPPSLPKPEVQPSILLTPSVMAGPEVIQTTVAPPSMVRTRGKKNERVGK